MFYNGFWNQKLTSSRKANVLIILDIIGLNIYNISRSVSTQPFVLCSKYFKSNNSKTFGKLKLLHQFQS